MSDFYHLHVTKTARKEHRCSYCGEPIPAGDRYVYQTGIYDGRWFVSRMHSECFGDLVESGEDEYILYSNERPSGAAK